jgi:hypothetical protein
MAGLFGEVPSSRRYFPAVTVSLGWFCALFFAFCAYHGVKRFFDSSPQLRIGPEGILWPRWSDSLMPWSEIRDVTTWSHRGQKHIILHLDDPARFPGRGLAGRLAGANRMLTGGDVAISLTGTDRRYGEAWRRSRASRAALASQADTPWS